MENNKKTKNKLYKTPNAFKAFRFNSRCIIVDAARSCTGVNYACNCIGHNIFRPCTAGRR